MLRDPACSHRVTSRPLATPSPGACPLEQVCVPSQPRPPWAPEQGDECAGNLAAPRPRGPAGRPRARSARSGFRTMVGPAHWRSPRREASRPRPPPPPHPLTGAPAATPAGAAALTPAAVGPGLAPASRAAQGARRARPGPARVPAVRVAVAVHVALARTARSRAPEHVLMHGQDCERTGEQGEPGGTREPPRGCGGGSAPSPQSGEARPASPQPGDTWTTPT